LEKDRMRIHNEIDAVLTERQWVITQARKGTFPVSDMEHQLTQLTYQEVTLRRELSTLGEAININALENWEENVAEFLADLKAGVDELKTVAPQTPEEQHEIFLLKKRVVDTLVERIEIDKERNLHVQIRLNLLDILRKDARNETTAGVQNLYPYTIIPRSSPSSRNLRVTISTGMPICTACWSTSVNWAVIIGPSFNFTSATV
jgi:hypothetical protein